MSDLDAVLGVDPDAEDARDEPLKVEYNPEVLSKIAQADGKSTDGESSDESSYFDKDGNPKKRDELEGFADMSDDELEELIKNSRANLPFWKTMKVVTGRFWKLEDIWNKREKEAKTESEREEVQKIADAEFDKETEKIIKALLSQRAEEVKVDEADIQLLKDKVFGAETFWVTEVVKDPNPLIPGVVFRGNIRGEVDVVYDKVGIGHCVCSEALVLPWLTLFFSLFGLLLIELGGVPSAGPAS